MIVFVAFAVGCIGAGTVFLLLRPLLSQESFARTNVHNKVVPTAGGLAIVIPAVVAAAGGARHGFLAAGIAAGGFGMLGLADDLAGDQTGSGGTRGLRGHLTALARGRLTTGVIKLVVGPVVALATVAALPDTALVLPAVVVALSANMGNLLDRAPGRCTKVGLAVGIPAIAVAIAAPDHRPIAGVAFLLGAATAVLPADLGERVMLGDTGANVVGAGAGMAVVLATGFRGQIAAAIILGALTLASERWSFSEVIERVPPLRAFDALGRAR